jgi:4-hydroxy-tetrahydrodipicolinate reductase
MKLALIGYGKMGKTIEALAGKLNHEIIMTIDRDNLSVLTSELFKCADVAIEFTMPNQAFSNIIACFDAGVPVVCGTTGWYDRLEELTEICEIKKGALLYASNFSIGVNLFFALNKYLANQMSHYPDYDVSMIETHHTAKLDAPSGTAITLAEDLIKYHKSYDRWTRDKKEGAHSFPIRSIRENPAPGKHEIRYISEVDEINISHEAYNRNGFASGALHAANWLRDKQGVFHFSEALSLPFS